MLTVKAPQLNFNSDGIPCSDLFADPYFSLVNPLEESQHVFLNSSNIAQRWENKNFTIAELGFGFGINFITTLNAWREQSRANQRLHYISFEKHPVQLPDLVKCYQHLNILPALSEPLIKHYPLPIEGFHRIEINEFNISLTLIFGDATDYLKECDFTADAWYLDGFAPNKNPALWTEEIANQVHRLTKVNGTFSTYSAASEVKRCFSLAGFHLNKQSGYGKKREMLVGQRKQADEKLLFPLKRRSWLLNSKTHTKEKRAMVIGGGLAGCAISAALAKRGWQVTIIEKNNALASEASGNPNAILMPRLSVDHDVQSQLTLMGFLFTVRYLSQLQDSSDQFNWHQCGAIQIPRDNLQWQRMKEITSQESIPEELLHKISKMEASLLSGCEISHDGWHIPSAGWLDPAMFCQTIINQQSHKVNTIFNTEVQNIKNNNGRWTTYNNNEQEIYSADTLIIANAFTAKQFHQTHWCELHAKRGQITLIPNESCNTNPVKVVCADAYITPSTTDKIVLGASFISGETNIDIRPQEHEDNIAKIQKIIPTFNIQNTNHLDGRAAIRAVSSDRLPIVGPVASQEEFDIDFKNAALGSVRNKYPMPQYLKGLYLATGFGSRGLTWIPLCMESLASTLNNEPNPLGKNLRDAIHPNRFLMKNLVKRVQSST